MKPRRWSVASVRSRSARLGFLFPAVFGGMLLSSAPNLRSAADEPPNAPGYEKSIQPLLEKRCYSCHGAKGTKGGLRLDSRAHAMKGGNSGPVIVAGRSGKSELLARVTSDDDDLRMPPRGERLTKEEVAILRQWIDAGANWPAAGAATIPETHWSLKPLARVAVPAHAAGSHPLDAFVDAALAKKQLRRSSPADRRTLVRRLTFDLTGLPPTPAEVKAFVESSDPKAYEALVDRLLASPRYGEHWARHWLDVAHYADTHGNDHDYHRPNAWPYRDYVINSFNDDKPYARFVAEQVAGDVLFPEDSQAAAALGFLAAGPWDHTLMSTIREDTVDHRMGQNLDRDNMVSTVMGTFTSLTVHCARCHNHKFDPVSQREYYALQAVFAGVDRADRPFDADPKVHAQRRQLLARKSAIAARDSGQLATLDPPTMAAKVAAIAKASRWEALDVLKIGAADGTVFTKQDDGSWFVSGTRPAKDTFTITTQTKLVGVRALRLEVLPDKRLPQGGPGRYDNGNFHLSQFRATVKPAAAEAKAAALAFIRALADHADAGDVIANALDEKPDTYWSIHPQYNQPHAAVFELKEPAGFDGGTTLTIQLEFAGKPGHQIGRFRLSASTQPVPVNQKTTTPTVLPPVVAAILNTPAEQRTPEQRRELGFHVLATDVEHDLAKLPPQQLVYAATRDFTPSGSFKPSPKPRPIHLLTRGDINRPGDLVGPGTTACVPNLPASLTIANAEDESLRRGALARWLTDDRNVLVWRSIVNRVWHYHFGRGICDTPNDFGRMGGTPSHPEMLDWLAVWFRDDAKGSLKALHRLIVTSATYQQTSLAKEQPTAASLDSDNRLLWRMNRSRLTGEMVRDAVLQMSGKLDPKMSGPSVVQFKHKGVAATFMPADGSPAFLDYERFDPDAPENFRRAVYRFVFRTVPDPLLDALDCPDGGAATPVRNASTTALQALAFLNNAFLIRQCEHVAAHIAKDTNRAEEQAALAFRVMLQRPPDDRETLAFSAYIRRHGLANACHVLLNSNEFLYID
ncbi:MAG TPA: PSD1 and planctomycete cytochrome C domain-containing protein [Urbifossiella sp.]|nr:PSD1 and planctomycete cytochrome C domain-containing protein [Urbifossiella sp.]